MNKAEVYFRNIFFLPADPWEGCGTDLTANQHMIGIMTGCIPSPFPGQPIQHLSHYPFDGKLAQHQHFVSCWHQNDELTPDMWACYVPGGHGAVVRSTVGRLIESLKDVPEEIFVGEVMYYDRENVPMPWSVPEWMVKDIKFTWESEVRAVVKCARKGATESSVSRRCDLSVLIDKVYLSPTATAETATVVEELLRKAGLQLPLGRA